MSKIHKIIRDALKEDFDEVKTRLKNLAKCQKIDSKKIDELNSGIDAIKAHFGLK